MGNCLFAYGRKLGELCRRDADCESGLICDVSAASGASVSEHNLFMHFFFKFCS